VRVVLADDHPIVRAGLRHVLEAGGEIDVVAEAGDGRALVQAVETEHPDVAVVDISMPELNGIDATRIVRRQLAPTRVLVLSVFCTETTVLDAIEAGASGYLLKDTATEELERAVLAVAENKAFFSPAVARMLANRLTERGRRRAQLSGREREVVQLIGEGRAFRDIAARLFISPRTVKTHRTNAMRKLGAKTTADLVRYAITHGLASQ
jgi:DNA-binding NarL/FixJ family response regulator